jgi:hypothetical protein
VTRLLLAFVLLSGCASAQWTTADTIRQGAIVALQAADYFQTRTIATETYSGTDCLRWTEQNPILGEHPTVGQVNAFFITAIAANALVSYLLPPTWRMGWQYLSVGYQGNVVLDNHNAGISG